MIDVLTDNPCTGLSEEQREVLRGRKRKWQEAALIPRPPLPAKVQFKGEV